MDRVYTGVWGKLNIPFTPGYLVDADSSLWKISILVLRSGHMARNGFAVAVSDTFVSHLKNC